MNEYKSNRNNGTYSSFFTLNLNSLEKIEDIADLKKQLSNLNMNGISTPYNRSTDKFKRLYFHRVYYLPVFQQKVLKIYKVMNNKKNTWMNTSVFKDKEKISLKEMKNFNSGKEERRVKRLAIRAIYALNLDFGIVKIGITSGVKPWVLFVNTHPEENEKMSPIFDKAIADFKKEWEKNILTSKKDSTIGCDPEFILLDSDRKLVVASKYLPRKGKVGCDMIWVNQDRNQLPIAELRPIPAKEPRDLAINLYNTMLMCSRKIPNKKLIWVAGGIPIKNYPLGGHLHFSNVWLNSFLLRALDNYLGIMMVLFEDSNSSGRRPKYGFLGDYREKFHGGFEYRTLPSWLVSPTLTKGVFALAKVIIDNYLYLYQYPLSKLSVQKAYYDGDKEKLLPIYLKLWNELAQLQDFAKYKNYLEPLKKFIDNHYTWDETKDLRKPWCIAPYNKSISKKKTYTKKKT